MARKYRVLSLDGGGCWALIEVKALIDLYGKDTSGHDVLRDFDLVAANSGGSIVLGCLLENLTLDDILNNFFLDETKRRSVFSPTTSFGDRALHDLTGLGPKYSAKNKLPALQTAIPGQGNKTLSDAIQGVLGQQGTGKEVHLLIVGFDYDRCRAKFFRSQPDGAPDPAKELTLAEAIHASTNAPVNYFDGPADYLDSPDRYWDGGITGNNNPLLVGVTEAIGLTHDFTEIVALSLGTATVALPAAQPGQEGSPFVRQPSPTGLVNDLRKLATAILDDPPDMATYIAHVMTGNGAGLDPAGPANSQIVRMNPLLSPVLDASNQWQPPAGLTAAQFHALLSLDMDAIQQSQVESIAAYADQWIQDNVPNQPVRMDGDTLVPEIGQGRYSKAKAAWLAIQ